MTHVSLQLTGHAERRRVGDQLASAETGAEQRGKRPRTAVDARTDGDDVKLVTTSASGELPNHPETKAAVEQASPETNATLNPRKEP